MSVVEIGGAGPYGAWAILAGKSHLVGGFNPFEKY